MINTMEPAHDYFTLPDSKSFQRSSWDQQPWPHAWEAETPTEMPIWQYTATALQHGEPQMPFYLHELPISPYTDPRPSAIPSPVTVFTNDGRYLPVTPIYDTPTTQHSNRSTPQSTHLRVPDFVESAEADDAMEDEDSDSYAWDSSRNSPPSSSTKQRPSHRRAQSANEISLKNAKRAHTVVERNYRERLNDKIADLALYLFETSSDSRTKPSKSLVMTRAKERLKQLEARNKALEGEVVKLRQHIAILDHIVTTKGGNGEPTPPHS